MHRLFTSLLSTSFILASLSLSVTAQAETQAYTDAAFSALQNSGKSVVLEVHAPWCPTCRAQAPVVKALAASEAYQEVQVLHIDFDRQKDALKKFNVSKQSTLIGYKGKQETARSTGATSQNAIEAIFNSTL